jgi:polysaccharide biosynthesis/export protein
MCICTIFLFTGNKDECGMMNKILIMTMMGCGLFFLFCGPGFCQSSAKMGYRMGAGDEIELSVRAGGEVQLNANLVVGDDGRITVPLIGEITATGLTTRELEEKIRFPLARDYFVDPQVYLQITKYRSLQFFISGAIGGAGSYTFDFTPTIMDLLAKAGGVSSNSGSVAYILRDSDPGSDADQTPIKVDLLKLLDQGDMSENIQLEPGDTVYIPEGSKLNETRTKIFVDGRVGSPGVLSFYPGMTAFTACIMAGGFSEFAAPNRTKIIRKTDDGLETIMVNLNRVQAGKDPDFPLQPGDRIHVPESWL